MVRPGHDLLTGRVEVDETHLGGLRKACLVGSICRCFGRKSSRSVLVRGAQEVAASSFFRLAQQAVAVDHVPYDPIVHPTPQGKTKAKPQSIGAT